MAYGIESARTNLAMLEKEVAGIEVKFIALFSTHCSKMHCSSCSLKDKVTGRCPLDEYNNKKVDLLNLKDDIEKLLGEKEL